MDFEMRSVGGAERDRSQAAIKEYAKTCRIKKLIWIKKYGNARVEIVD